jgi:2-phosphosulfolactate phosphatase
VYFGPAALPPAEWHGRTVVVIDVLRACTTIATALFNGARSVIPFDSADEAVTRSKSFERGEVILAGERRMVAIPGFDLGNSPRAFTPNVVEGKTILFTTTNGTAALVAVQGARQVYTAAFVNLSAITGVLRAAYRAGHDLTVVCSGSERQFALEDAVCAGRLLRRLGKRLTTITLNDAARAAMQLERRYARDVGGLIDDATHARSLTDAGLGDDVPVCLALDTCPVIPVYAERQITRAGAGAGRRR